MCRHEFNEVALDALDAILERFLPAACGFVVASHGRSLLLSTSLSNNILFVATPVSMPKSIIEVRLLISPTGAKVKRPTLASI